MPMSTPSVGVVENPAGRVVEGHDSTRGLADVGDATYEPSSVGVSRASIQQAPPQLSSSVTFCDCLGRGDLVSGAADATGHRGDSPALVWGAPSVLPLDAVKLAMAARAQASGADCLRWSEMSLAGLL